MTYARFLRLHSLGLVVLGVIVAVFMAVYGFWFADHWHRSAALTVAFLGTIGMWRNYGSWRHTKL